MSTDRGPKPQSGIARLRSSLPLALILVLLLAFGLRVYGMTFGAPFEGYYWWDERSAITKAWSFLRDPGLPSIRRGLYPMMLSAVYYPLSIAQNQTWDPRAVVSLSLNQQLLIARALSVMAGTVLVAAVYALGRRLSGYWGGLAAALLTATSPTLVAESRYATTGMFVTLLIYLAMLPLTNSRIPFWKRAIPSLVFSTLAVLTKSNGVAAFALLPLALPGEILAVRSHHPQRIAMVRRITAILAIGCVGLLTVTWLVDRDLLLRYWHQATTYARINRPGASPGAAWRWMFGYEWGILLGGVAGVVLSVIRRDRLPRMLLTMAFVALYGLAISFFSTLFARWLMVILPGLAVLAGMAVSYGLSSRHTLLRVLATSLLLAALAASTVQAVRLGHNLLHDARIAAWEWAQAQLPAGAKIAAELHSLPDGAPVSTRYRIETIKRAIDHPSSYYVENGFHFLMIADDMYDRWHANPAEHPAQMKDYAALFEEFEEIASFHGTLLHAPPAIDIHVLQIAANPVYPEGQIVLGAGWHGEEIQAGIPRRWMSERGQVFYNHSGEGGEKQVLSFDAYVFRDKDEITAYVNDQPGIPLSLDTAEALRHVEIPVNLVEGLNRVELVSERGCGCPIVYNTDSKDLRCISIKVGNLKLEVLP